jgi:hypothetical protein
MQLLRFFFVYLLAALLKYNLHILQFPQFKVYNSMTLIILTELCIHFYFRILSLFHEEPTHPLTFILQSPVLSRPRKPLICFCLCRFTTLGHPTICGITQKL